MRYILLFLMIYCIGIASAHVPLIYEGHDHLETALLVTDPEKSWAIYGALPAPDQPHYYSLLLRSGERLKLVLITPEQMTQPPSMAIMGPDFPALGSIPQFLEVPQGSGLVMIPGKMAGEAEYEPFTPAAIYPAGEFSHEIQSDGSYFVAVYGSQPGSYSLAIGYREEFSLAEWILVPVNALAIHRWEGQPLWFILAPMAGVMVVVGGILIRVIPCRMKPSNLTTVLSLAAGLLYLGGSAITLTQMGMALFRTGLAASAIVTLLFILVPLVLGVLLIRWGWQERAEIRSADRLVLLGWGILGLFLWSGLLAGPVLALLGAFLPNRGIPS